jgi:two-component system nitrogen regulation response regulator NtrX
MDQQPLVRSDLIQNRRILIVDDHRNIRISLRMTLEGEGARITEAESVKTALEKMGPLTVHDENHPFPFDCVLLDIRLPDGSGLDILKGLSEVGLASRVVMISGEGTVGDAFKATQMGAFDFVEKPFGEERIIVSVARCLDFGRLSHSKEKLEERLKSHEILGEHPKIQETIKLIKRVAPTNGRVLITGESGTGKELVARAIHRESSRSDKPLIKVNCAAIPQNLIESELFGHEKGSFTGATKTRKGVFERADGGTLFLDEIGELGLDVQAKLLRALQNGEIQRVGGEKVIVVDVRLLAATNRDLPEMVATGEFREDLYYRLNVLTIHLPPLRERRSDIDRLAKVFLKEACEEHSLGEKTLSADALLQLSAYSWPGNIRELHNLIERTAILSEEPVIECIDDLGPAAKPEKTAELASGREPSHPAGAPPHLVSEKSMGQDAEFSASATELSGEEGFVYAARLTSWQDFHEGAGRSYLRFVLQQAGGNVSEAARLLGLERAYLHRLMKKLGVQRDVIVS